MSGPSSSMHRSGVRNLAIVLSAIFAAFVADCASAAVAIIANRTQSPIRFDARPHAPGAGKSRRLIDSGDKKSKPPLVLDLSGAARKLQGHIIDAGDCIAVPFESSQRLSIRGAAFGEFELRPYGVYYFGSTQNGKVELREIGLQAAPARQGAGAPGLIGAQADLHAAEPGDHRHKQKSPPTILLSVFVDDDENAVEQLWQKRIQDRVASASKILQRACGVRLAIRSFGRWESNDADTEFTLALREFERTVDPGDAQVAVGFTSQYTITRGRTHLGGTHGPMHSHILLREWSQHVSEPERLEMLVHELGHYLGAVHSPEGNSVMRPVLGDRQARARAFRICFDPVNALAMSIVGEEIRNRGISSFGQLSEPSRTRLEGIYATLTQALPDDAAAASYLLYVRRQFRVE